jgi:hypothetical protein
MTGNWNTGKLTLPQKRVLIYSLGALVLCLAMNIYHYSLEGAKGLYLWNRTGMFRSLILMGFLPGTIALLSFPLEKLKNKKVSKIARGTAITLSILVALLSAGILAFLIAGPRQGSVEPAKLTLMDPSKGIATRGFESAAFRSGDTSGAVPATPANVGAPALRLSFSSDPHWGATTSNAGARMSILASVAEHKPDAFFMLGDTVETGSSSIQWNFALADLEAAIPKVPLRVLLGNHDALLGGQYLFKKAFFPKGFSSDSGSPYYYKMDSAAATIIVVDLPWGTENFGRKQRTWLENALKSADRAKPLIVLSHSFFYASGYDDPDLDKPWYDHYQNIPALVPLFEKYGVNLVISGHNHYQEYLENKGVRYAVIGAMGGIPDPEPSHVSPASKWRAVGKPGRLDVDIYDKDIVMTFRDESGNPLHEERFSYR